MCVVYVYGLCVFVCTCLLNVCFVCLMCLVVLCLVCVLCMIECTGGRGGDQRQISTHVSLPNIRTNASGTSKMPLAFIGTLPRTPGGALAKKIGFRTTKPFTCSSRRGAWLDTLSRSGRGSRDFLYRSPSSSWWIIIAATRA